MLPFHVWKEIITFEMNFSVAASFQKPSFPTHPCDSRPTEAGGHRGFGIKYSLWVRVRCNKAAFTSPELGKNTT